jgi:hypothetical protein
MDHIPFFVEFGAILLALIGCPFLIMTLLRSHKIPECFSCGAMKVRPSRPSGWWDSVCGFFMIQPYRCGGCRERFHALLIFGGSRQPAAIQPAQAQRVVKVVFRFRHGVPNKVTIRVTHLHPEPASTDPAAVADSGPAILRA